MPDWKLKEYIWTGVKYGTDEAADARWEAERAFNKKYCLNNVDETKMSCLERIESDGDTFDGIDYAIGYYMFGNRDDHDKYDKDYIEIGLITDGNGKCGWFYSNTLNCNDPHEKALEDRRLFDCEPIDAAQSLKDKAIIDTFKRSPLK